MTLGDGDTLLKFLRRHEIGDPWTKGLRSVVIVGTAEEVLALIEQARSLPSGGRLMSDLERLAELRAGSYGAFVLACWDTDFAALAAREKALVRVYEAAVEVRSKVDHVHLGSDCPVIELDAALAAASRALLASLPSTEGTE